MVKSAVKNFDLFSKSFVFFVGNKKSKQTFFGGILSLAVLAVSGTYFYYLLNMYFSNQIEPKITQSNVIEASYTSLKIQDSFFIFQYFIGGVPLILYQEQVNKTFLTFSVNYEMLHTNGTIDRIPIPLIFCTDELFLGYICLDPSEVIDKNIFMDITQNTSSLFSLEINYCDPTIYDNCASPTELYNTIFRRQNVFSINIQVKQYIATSREYQSGYKQEYFYLDPNNVVFTRFSLIQASTTVIKGMVIQSSESNNTIYDFKRIDTVFSNNDIQTRLDFSGIAILAFENNQVKNIITVQHAMITEILAQFMSIFNSLLTVGILCRMLAATHIIEDMNSILLKEYYKQTALRLVSRHDSKSEQNKRIPSTINNTEKRESETIGLLQKRIKEIDFSEQSRKYFDLSCMNRCRTFFSKLLGKPSTIKKNKKNSQLNDSDAVIYQHLLNQSVKRINIFEVYKDMIKLKMAIKLILTKDQYAAIQFCGSELAIEEKENQKEQKENNKNNNNLQQDVKQCLPTPLVTAGINQSTPQPKNSLRQEKYEEGVSRIDFPLSLLNNCSSTQGNMQTPTRREEQENNLEEQYQQKNYVDLLLKTEDSRKDTNNEENNDIHISSLLNTVQQQSIIELSKSEFPVKEKTIRTFQDNMQFIHRDQDESDLIFFNNQNVSTAKTEDISQKISQNIDVKNFLKIAKNRQLKYQKNEGKFRNNLTITEKSYFDLNKNSHGSVWNANRSHLYEMDRIEEDSELQQQLLQTFLDRVKSTKEGQINDHVDRQIFASLIKYEKQMNLLSCNTQMAKKIQGSALKKNQQEKNSK